MEYVNKLQDYKADMAQIDIEQSTYWTTQLQKKHIQTYSYYNDALTFWKACTKIGPAL